MSSRDKLSSKSTGRTSHKSHREQSVASSGSKTIEATTTKNVAKSSGSSRRADHNKKSIDSLRNTQTQRRTTPKVQKSTEIGKQKEDQDLNEMATTNLPENLNSQELEKETDVDEANSEEWNNLLVKPSNESTVKEGTIESSNNSFELRTDNHEHGLGEDSLPRGWEQHSDKDGLYYWHVSTGVIQRTRPTSELPIRKDSLVLYHDDEEINQAECGLKTSSDDDEFYESGAALTVDDTNESIFVVYPLGSCEFDETQLVSASSTKAIQKCILRLSNKPTKEESFCWGLDQTQPLLMRLFDDHIQFTDLKTRSLLRSQPIQTIKTWAVDDDNNFAFVIEDMQGNTTTDYQGSALNNCEAADYSLLSEPILMCFVFRSLDDDDMSCKVAAKLNEEINRHREQMSHRISKSTRIQQMIEQRKPITQLISADQTDADEDLDDADELEASNELTMDVKYIGKTPVPRPTGIEVLNIAIDKCLAEASKATPATNLIAAKLHVSPSSVIVENESTGEIIVECRIRYLTFMGISKRDIRWCGFIMQNSTNKTFAAHCFECYPTAGHVCEAIQVSCTKMYEKVVRSSRQPETMSIIPTRSKIRNTLAKTFSRIKLNPILN